MGNFNEFQNVGGPDDCSVRTTARVGSSAQRKQDNLTATRAATAVNFLMMSMQTYTDLQIEEFATRTAGQQ